MMRVYNYVSSTQALGPYNRFALWVAGCPFRCNHCMTPDAQPLDSGYEIDELELSRTINVTQDIEGITISGGEPFLQPKAISKMLENITNDLGVIVYTGFTMDKLLAKNCKDTTELLNKIDILIDGLYIDELNDGTQSLRGSSNQNIYQLTNRYDNVFDDYYHSNKRKIEIHLKKENIMVVGVPTKDTLGKIQDLWRKS